jgi:hypothetical protein
MTEGHIKEIIFNTLILVQGFPPIDTQLAEWEKAVNDMYEEMLPSLSFTPSEAGHDR